MNDHLSPYARLSFCFQMGTTRFIVIFYGYDTFYKQNVNIQKSKLKKKNLNRFRRE